MNASVKRGPDSSQVPRRKDDRDRGADPRSLQTAAIPGHGARGRCCELSGSNTKTQLPEHPSRCPLRLLNPLDPFRIRQRHRRYALITRVAGHCLTLRHTHLLRLSSREVRTGSALAALQPRPLNRAQRRSPRLLTKPIVRTDSLHEIRHQHKLRRNKRGHGSLVDRQSRMGRTVDEHSHRRRRKPEGGHLSHCWSGKWRWNDSGSRSGKRRRRQRQRQHETRMVSMALEGGGM